MLAGAAESLAAGAGVAAGVVVAVAVLDEPVELDVLLDSWQPAVLSTTATSAVETTNARMLLSFGNR
jgi:hypothetical protein